MYKPHPIKSDYVPYAKRSVLPHNAGLFVDGGNISRGSPVVAAHSKIFGAAEYASAL